MTSRYKVSTQLTTKTYRLNSKSGIIIIYMDKEFSSAPLGSKERSADLMSAGQQMLQSSRNTQTAIPADSLVPTQPAPQLPPAPVDTRIVTNNQVAIPEQGAVTQQPQAEVKPPTLKESLTQQMQSMLSGGKNVNREEIRNELQIAEKQKKSQDIENQIIARQRSYNDQIERLQSNPDKLLNASKLNAQQNLLSREFSRELAELSFAQKIANDDYMGAERLMSDRIKDFQDQRNWEMQTFQVAFDFVQNDMTESEKIQAQQAFQTKQATEDFERQKEMALFQARLQRENASFSASLSGADAPTIKTINGVDMQWNPQTGQWVPAQTTVDPTQAQKSLDQFAFLEETVASAKKLSTAAGPSGITRFLGDKFVGDTKFRQLEQKTNTLKTNVLTLMTDPSIKKFFGPQMSEADVRLMTSAGTTLDAQTNSPSDLKLELGRLEDLFGRMKTSVQQGMGSTGSTGGNVIKAPDGSFIEIID